MSALRRSDSAQPPGKHRLAVIDAFRGVAALGVFVFHAGVIAGFPKRVLPPVVVAGHRFSGVLSPVGLGASGVSLFFVISGFCLMLQRLRAVQAGQPIPARVYARNRFARIVPAYWTAVLFAAASWFFLGANVPRVIRDTLVHLAFLHGFSGHTFLSLNDALWSMITEAQFYLVFPWLAVWLERRGWRHFVAGTLVLTLACRVLAILPPSRRLDFGVALPVLITNQLPGRLWEFALGMALAGLILGSTSGTRLARRFLWLLLVIVAPALCVRTWGPAVLSEPLLGLTYFACAGFLLASRASQPARDASRLWRWGGRFGRASYSFFLLHVPVLLLTKAIFPSLASQPYALFGVLLVLGGPLALIAAAVLYRGVELPLWTRLYVAHA
jgi:peptidoglycan/LPS O-acetylase OafA/YrhL